MNTAAIRIGADVGGTFTDVVALDEKGGIWTCKVPSTPPNFERAVLEAMDQLLPQMGAAGAGVREVAHGTTVATNAVLEHRGARTALITTRGFRDVLELRRIRAPQLYDLFFDKPQPLVGRRLRLEVDERLAADGQVLVALEESELQRLGDRLEEEGVEAVAVCLLHAYAFAQHEQRLGAYLRARLPQIPVSLSSEVLPERREYERSATTVVNAYVQPVMQRYLGALRKGLGQRGIAAPLLIMQSTGGLAPDEEAARHPVFVLESGPAAGVLGASFAAGQLDLDNLITLDMGGTTAKAAMIEEGRIAYSPEYEVGASLSAGNRLIGGGGELIRAPSIDIAEVGAGGGSIAFLDQAGGLRVGPQSAGALPGPACYQRGGREPTLTDANVVLGYIRPGDLADGEVAIDPEAARRAVHDCIARPLGLDLLQAAEGIHRIANARTMRALRAVSTERGRDPRDFALMAFGGAGPIHAAGLARELAIDQIVVPPLPGVFSALGLLCSGVEHHGVYSCLLGGPQLGAPALEEIRARLQQRLMAQFAAEGFGSDQVSWRCSADMRFRGQTSEIGVELAAGPIDVAAVAGLGADFALEHERLYGHRSDPDNPVEVVAVRLVGQAGVRGLGSSFATAARPGLGGGSREVYFAGESVAAPVLERGALAAGAAGPLLIDEYDSTIVVPPGWRARRDELGHVLIEAQG